jgi:protein SCO1/2
MKRLIRRREQAAPASGGRTGSGTAAGRRLAVLATTGVPILLALTLVACSDRTGPTSPPSPFASTDITGVDWGRDFQLIDHHGKPRSLADFRGRVVMLFMGYTHCPDVCPTTLAEMAQVRSRLGEKGRRVQGLFVTVDPKRDTPQVLARYVRTFDPSFLGLYGDEDTIASLARDFKIYRRAEHTEHTEHTQHAGQAGHGEYTVGHSDVVFVFDPQGRLRLMMRPGTGIEAMAADIALLLKE